MLTKLCKNTKIRKSLALILALILLLADFMVLSKNLISYAFEENLENQTIGTQHSNVRFDAYFNNSEGNNVHSVIYDATDNSNKINVYLSVKDIGYLKEGYIDFRNSDGSTDTNYELADEALNTTLIQSVNKNLKTITLNCINAGTEAVLEIPISLKLAELIDINKLNQNTYVTLRGIYVDENGDEINIYKTTTLNLKWNVDTDIEIEQAVTKYVSQETSDGEDLIIQLGVKVKQNRDDNAMPVKSTEVKIKVPEISETLPEKITVITGNTGATNGNKVDFTSEDWEYNEEEKTITINTKGYEENGKVWAGTSEDEYYITYVYKIDQDSEIDPKAEIPLTSEINAKMELYTSEGITTKEATSAGEAVLDEKIGEIVSYSIKANENEISKGKIYANYNSEEKTYSTEYGSTIEVNVSDYEVVNEISMQLSEDTFMSDYSAYPTKINEISYTNINKLEISKNQMQALLGEDGYVSISDDSANTYIINKDTEDVDGIYVVEFAEEVGAITIVTSKPVSDGILKINTTKSISKDLPYQREHAMQFKELKLNMVGKTTCSKIVTTEVEDKIALTETTTHATLQMSNTSYTSMLENKNVKMTIELNNNVETSDLYKNPVFTVSLPKYIEDIEITTGNILYTSGLEIDYVEKIFNENGIVLVIHVKGAETNFSDGVFTNGANIMLNTNIKVNMLTPNISDKITMTYTNESAVSYKDDSAYDEVVVNFTSPEEMVTFNTVLTSGIESTSTEGNEQTAKLEILDSSKIATMKISMLNKYSYICNNIRVLGRLPFEGNKEILTGNDLGTTFDAKLINEINTNGIPAQVYYSANGEATEDLNNEVNGWTTDILLLEEIKSYLIVLPQSEMKPGEMLEFSYNCQIPENLEHNESAFGTYVVYYDTVSEYIAQNMIEAERVGLTTGVGANIEMSTKTIYQDKEITDSDVVKEYQTVTYKTTISNTGTVDATGVELTSTIENGTIISANDATIDGQKITWNFDIIRAGETATVEYDVNVVDTKSIVSDLYKDDGGYYKEEINFSTEEGLKIEKVYVDISEYFRIKNKVNLSARNFDGIINTINENEIKETQLMLKLTIDSNECVNGYTSYMKIYAQNVSNNPINNLVITQKMPIGMDYIAKEDSTMEYNKETRTITIRVNKLEADEMLSKTINFKTNIPNNVGKTEVKSQSIATGDGIDTYCSNFVNLNIESTVLDISLSSNLSNGGYIKEQNNIEITGTIQNNGVIESPNTIVNIDIPKEFNVSKAKYFLQNGNEGSLTATKEGNYYMVTSLGVGEKITIKIEGTAYLAKDVSEKEINFVAKVSDRYREEVSSNTLRYIVEKSTPINGNNGSSSSNVNNSTNPGVSTYRITGVAWLDENGDGQKQSSEKLMSDVNVLLVNSEGVIVTDQTNGTPKETKTSNNGQYTFTNIPQGRYMVIFEYDSGHYDVTEYKKAGVADDLTSKAREVEINKDGKVSIAGVTDVINITNSSISNINVGFVEKEKFDLSLTKKLTTVTVANSGGTQNYDFTNTKLGKIDIPAKYLSSTTVTLQYKIIVKNEGAIPGYARNIVDYLSKDLNFDSSNNFNWHIGQDGNLYCNALANTIINPGEEKTVTLLLTKRMNESNTGIITNRAEIYEDYNENGYKDYNSTPGNTSQQENDYDSVDVIVTVKTGQVALYITISLISIAIIGTGAYLINKKVLKGGKI